LSFHSGKDYAGDIKTEFVNSNDQLVDIFTKSLMGPKIDYIVTSLGHTIICSSLRGNFRYCLDII